MIGSKIGGAYYELAVEATKFTAGLEKARAESAAASQEIGANLERATDRGAKGAGLLTSALSRMTAGLFAAVVGFRAGNEVAEQFSEWMETGADKAEKFASSLDFTKPEQALKRLNDEIGKLQNKLSDQESNPFIAIRDFFKGDGASKTIEQIEALEKNALAAGSRIRREMEQADAEAADKKWQKDYDAWIKYEQQKYRTKESADRAITDMRTRQELEIADEAERIRLNALNNIGRIERETRVAAYTSPEVVAARNAAIEEEFRVRDQKLAELAKKNAEREAKEQAEILEKSAKIMADAIKEFGRHIDKLQQIQESWDDNFSGLQGGADIRSIRAILDSWGPQIRSIR